VLLSIVNGSGNSRPRQGAAEQFEMTILLLPQPGCRGIYHRGDTDFTRPKQLEAGTPNT
jgi:hypothetical protein